MERLGEASRAQKQDMVKLKNCSVCHNGVKIKA